MSLSWLLIVLATLVTGNPLAAVALALAVLWTADRVTLGLLPDPARALARWQRARRLRATLALNPNDRRARLELADLVLARRPAEAAALLRRNAEAGDEDVLTAFLLGAALARSGAADGAEKAFAFARGLEPGFRMGEIDLELGRLRLARGDAAGAREALDRLVAARPGTVEGRWLLSRALAAAGDSPGAARVRDDAWREFRALPRFRRRQDRRFAWRMRPLHGAAVMAAVVALVGAGALVVAGAAIAYSPGPAGESCQVHTGSEELAFGRQRMRISYVDRAGRIAHLSASIIPAPGVPRLSAAEVQAATEQRVRVLSERRDPRWAWAFVDDGAQLTVFPIHMGVADVAALRSASSVADVVTRLRAFEGKFGPVIPASTADAWPRRR
jgi:tetratricopeptide (TPR) repeat protein